MVDYAYDGAGRLTQQQVRVQVGAQQRTLTTSLQYADYWSIGSVWTQSVLLDGRTVANYAYSYYEDGTLHTASEQHAEPNGSSTQRQLGWDYYSDGSLQYERIGSQQRNFQYDLGGNLTLGVPAAPTLTAQYEYNQLRSLGNWEFAYNPNGERIGEQNAPDGNREYGYDGFGNLVWVRRNGQLIYEARYDALGRRVAYRTSNRDWDWIYLLYDGDMLVAELDAYGQVRAEYVWGSLGPVARIAGGRVQLYVCDALGHVRALIDAQTGQITDRYDYDAWGNLVSRAGTTQQPFTWNGAYGYEWIPEVSLYHVGARAYDPRTARWLQRDPIDAASGDPNLYRYCGNDPINMVDDGGTDWFKKTKDGLWIGPLLFNSEVVSEGLKTGLAAVGSALTLGFWDGGAYKDQPGFQTSVVLAGVGTACLTTAATAGAGQAITSSVRAARQVQQAANHAQRVVGAGRGPAHGTRVHTEFARQVQRTSRGRIQTEVSYMNGSVVPRGTRGAVRVDAVRGRPERPKEIWDLKTGGARLTPQRIQQIRRHLPRGCQNIPIREVRPR